jgi:hypothetical protein
MPQTHDRIETPYSVMSMTRPRVQRFLSRITREKRPDQTARAQSVGRAAALQPFVASVGRSWCGGLKTRHTTFFCAERETPLSVSERKCLYLTQSFTGKPSVLPNPSLKLTRYGKHCKPGPRHLVHHREPGLQRPPPRAA